MAWLRAGFPYFAVICGEAGSRNSAKAWNTFQCFFRGIESQIARQCRSHAWRLIRACNTSLALAGAFFGVASKILSYHQRWLFCQSKNVSAGIGYLRGRTPIGKVIRPFHGSLFGIHGNPLYAVRKCMSTKFKYRITTAEKYGCCFA